MNKRERDAIAAFQKGENPSKPERVCIYCHKQVDGDLTEFSKDDVLITICIERYETGVCTPLTNTDKTLILKLLEDERVFCIQHARKIKEAEGHDLSTWADGMTSQINSIIDKLKLSFRDPKEMRRRILKGGNNE